MTAALVKNLRETLARVRGALMRRGRNTHEADDLVQEAWVRLACYERDQPVQRPEAFLMRTALNLKGRFTGSNGMAPARYAAGKVTLKRP